MKLLVHVYAVFHAALALIFAGISVGLMVVAVRVSWDSISGGFDFAAASRLIEAMGITAVAVVALQISQTIVEEEVVREVHVSAPTRVRRFLSRFIVVVAIALAIEGLVATMKAMQEDPAMLPYAASVIVGVAALLAAWGFFIRCNRVAEDIEPESMAQAMDEDRKLD
ncbi:MAG: hypothetical protein M3Y67_00615 [Pseudomonadota bacterium]|nr:hypothetical protein [Pseudomonadota bacterium]